MRQLIYILFLSCLHGIVLKGQSNEEKSLSFEEFIDIVQAYHPLAKQAETLPELGRLQLVYARGAIDPKISFDVSEKYFKDAQYYSEIGGKMKIPTWFGVEFETGSDSNFALPYTPATNLFIGSWTGRQNWVEFDFWATNSEPDALKRRYHLLP